MYPIIGRKTVAGAGGGRELLYQRLRLYNTTDMFMRKTNLMHIKTLRHGANIRCLGGQ